MKKHVRTFVCFALLTGIFTGTSISFAAQEDKPSGANVSVKESTLFNSQNPKANALTSYRAKNYEEAYYWFGQAATKMKDPFSMFYLGLMNFQGEGVKRSHAAAEKWYKLSCESGFEMGCTALDYIMKSKSSGG